MKRVLVALRLNGIAGQEKLSGIFRCGPLPEKTTTRARFTEANLANEVKSESLRRKAVCGRTIKALESNTRP